MNSNLIRCIWQVVAHSDTAPCSASTSAELARQIMAQVDASYRLTPEEWNSAHDYILERVPLMHDLSMQG